MTRVHSSPRPKAQPMVRAPSQPQSARRPPLRLIKPSQTHSSSGTSGLESPSEPPEGIGLLDAAAAVGLHPSKSPVKLWMEKTGRAGLLQPLVAKEDVPTFWTRMFDPIVAAYYTRITGRRARRVNTVVRHPEHHWMFTEVEREVIDNPDVQLLSYLFVGPLGAPSWAKGMPDHVRVQAMHALAVTGKRAVELAVLMCGEELQIHRVERDDAVIARLIALEHSFWRHVELNQVPPEQGFLAPDVVRKVLCAPVSPEASFERPSKTKQTI